MGRRPSVAATVEATCSAGSRRACASRSTTTPNCGPGRPDGGRDLEAGRSEPVAAHLVSAALAGRRGEAQLGSRVSELTVVAPEAGSGGGHEEIVPAAAEGERGAARPVDRDQLETTEQRSRARPRRQRPTGHHQLAGDRVGHLEGALDTAHRRVRRTHVAGRVDAADQAPHRVRDIDRDRERARLAVAVLTGLGRGPGSLWAGRAVDTRATSARRGAGRGGGPHRHRP